MKHVLIWLVKGWRAIVSPWYGPVCKYYPSCSEYGLDALRVHGALKGTRLMVWRILRCNPWSKGGVDPVPGSELEAKVARWWAEDAAEAGLGVAVKNELTGASALPSTDGTTR